MTDGNTGKQPDLGLVVEVWKKTVDVQQHFNEICMKIRNFYISLISALLALIGVISTRLSDPYFQIWHYQVSAALPVLAAIVLGTLLFYFIDRHWYHRLLVGAVQNARLIESDLTNQIPGISLTEAIGKNSPLDVSGRDPGSQFWYWLGRVFGSDPRVKADKMIHSDAKIAIFYKSVAWVFLIVFLVTAFSGGIHGSASPVLNPGPVGSAPPAK